MIQSTFPLLIDRWPAFVLVVEELEAVGLVDGVIDAVLVVVFDVDLPVVIGDVVDMVDVPLGLKVNNDVEPATKAIEIKQVAAEFPVQVIVSKVVTGATGDSLESPVALQSILVFHPGNRQM